MRVVFKRWIARGGFLFLLLFFFLSCWLSFFLLLFLLSLERLRIGSFGFIIGEMCCSLFILNL